MKHGSVVVAVSSIRLHLIAAISDGESRGSNGRVTYQHVEHLLGLQVDLEGADLAGIDDGDLGHVVVAPLALLLLQLDADAAHRALLDPLHQMRHESATIPTLHTDETAARWRSGSMRGFPDTHSVSPDGPLDQITQRETSSAVISEAWTLYNARSSSPSGRLRHAGVTHDDAGEKEKGTVRLHKPSPTGSSGGRFVGWRWGMVEVGMIPGDLVAESFGRDDGDLLADALVGVEVEGELGVVLLDDHPSALLHRLRPHATLAKEKSQTVNIQLGRKLLRKTNDIVPLEFRTGSNIKP